MAFRDRCASLALGATFLGVALSLAVMVPSHRSPSFFIALFFAALLAAASRIEFEV
jgi:hypothetical protein